VRDYAPMKTVAERRGRGTHGRGGDRDVRAALILGALGVVFGDIYTMQTVFNPADPHPVPVSRESVLGIASLVFWSVTIVVTVTYVLLVMRADNGGEGGIMALITLVRGGAGSRRTKLILAALGVFGASLFLGDSMITPAISVLSSVEGLKVAEPSLGSAVVPITAVVIVLLFLFQQAGTGTVGRAFGPVMLVWFLVIAACGVGGIADHSDVLRALSPTYALSFFFGHFSTAFFALAAVVLSVTGAEALYADMGHFGRAPITRAWLLLVFPACTLSYLGQAGLILHNQANVSSPFFLLVPGWGQWPLVLLATAATVIASQAVITGAFSVAHQAVQLGYLPRLRIRHTSEETAGQVYVPWINWLLMVSVLTLVFTFESSNALAFAFGMAVTGTITITTLLFLYIARHRWGWSRPVVVAVGAPLLTVDALFLAANTTKIIHGAWLPLLIAVIVFTVLVTWQRGRELVTARRQRLEGPLREFIDELRTRRPPVRRVEGTAVFLNRSKETAPLAMRACVDHLKTLHEHVVVLTIETLNVPHVSLDDRLAVDDLGYTDDAITHASARFGYMDEADVPAVLRLLEKAPVECPLEVDEASYFLSTVDLTLGDDPGLSRWRKRLFLATAAISADAAEYFRLPRDQTVIMGARLDV
jgi:KUP system potassium uptake protein